jgi:hypothetical protein
MQKLIGVRILQRGVIGKHCLVSNHISYLDILVIGGQSNITFVAKNEVEKWPVIGYARRQLNKEMNLSASLRAAGKYVYFPKEQAPMALKLYRSRARYFSL